MTFKVYIKLKHENILCRNPKSRHLAAMKERGNSSGKVLTKEKEQPCIPVCDEKPISILETRTRISFFQSHVRDKNENFFLSISRFKTRTRISFLNLRLRDENENRDWDNSRENFWELRLLLLYPTPRIRDSYCCCCCCCCSCCCSSEKSPVLWC